jgi:hypothetical protein
VLTTGSGDPTTNCSAPSAINLAKYYDATAKKMWTCVDVNTWQLDLTVDPTATLLIGGNVGVAPATPGSRKVHVYSDSTLKGLSAKDDAGQITRTVKPTDCSSTGFVSKVNADGTVTCAAGGSPYDPTDVTVLDTAPFFPARLTNDNDKSGLWSLNTPSCVGVSVSTFGLAAGQAAYLWQDAHAGAACLVSFPSTYNNAGGPLADFLSGGTPLPFTLQTLFGRDATHDGDIAVGMSQSASNADNFAGCYYSASAGNWQAVIRSGGAVVGSPVTVVAGDSSMHWVRASGTGVANTVTCSVGSSSATVTQTIPAGTWFAIHGAVSTGVDTPRFRSSEVRFHLAGRVAD